MGFVADIIETVVDAVVDIIETIVDIVVQIVETVVTVVMTLLGFNQEDQVVEYFDVRNVPLFEDPDKQNPLVQVIARSILTNQDIASEVLYATAFRSMKRNLAAFINHIDDGNYFEGFPQIESHITYPDYDELSNALFTLNGVPCTPERSSVGSLSASDWVRYWLQENVGYDVGDNLIIGAGYETVSTAPPTIPVTSTAATVTITVDDEATTSDDVDETAVPVGDLSSSSAGTTTESLAKTITLDIDDTVGLSDSMYVDTRWRVDFTLLTYDEISETYSVSIYNDQGDTVADAYTVPIKPLQMHYVSFYYRDSDPSRQYLFVYKVGEGTYPDLDDPNNPINIDPANFKTVPAIPLRLSNTNYTDFDPTKKQKIDDLLRIINMDGEAILDSILDDPDAQPGDIDHIYVNFGVRMWDTSQIGLKYLFNMFQNLYPAQGTNKGTYDNTPTEDEKPYNKLIVTAEDYKYAFQFAYITYQFTSLVDIDADTGSVENGIYYSDMSKFDANGDLVYPYYSSSGKGTYNVGYKADNLQEVQDFLAGNGVINPGDTTGEATNWLQVTQRISYTDPLQDPDGSASDMIYLVPDMVYENVGGTLRIVNAASEETTAGQSITYYYITEVGLEAYTVQAPLGALRVEDGDTGVFRVIKFNLGNRDDLMVPLIYSFISELSNSELSMLFLTGAHASIYLARYEVIEASGFNLLLAIVLIVIIIVIVVLSAGTGSLTASSLFAPTTTATGTTAAGATYTGSVTITAGEAVIASGPLTGTALATGTVTSTAAFTGIVSTAAISGGTVGALSVSLIQTAIGWLGQFAVSSIIKAAIKPIAKDNPELAAALGIAAGFAARGLSYNNVTGTLQFTVPTFEFSDVAKMFANAADVISSVIGIHVEGELDSLAQEWAQVLADTDTSALKEAYADLFRSADGTALSLLDSGYQTSINPMLPEQYYAIQDAGASLQFIDYDIGERLALTIDPDIFT